MCSESGLPNDLSWGRLGYIRWLDTAQDLCHSKATHPLDLTDFTVSTRVDTEAVSTCRRCIQLMSSSEEVTSPGLSSRPVGITIITSDLRGFFVKS